MQKNAVLICIALAWLTLSSEVRGSIVTSFGAVTALNNVSQLLNIIGGANFDEGPTTGDVPLGTYTPQGMKIQAGNLSSILPGVTTPTTYNPGPGYWSFGGYFPAPSGGGTAAGQHAINSVAATFSTAITQFGLTASINGTQFMTAWDMNGTMLGQVKWEPHSSSSFVGIDTGNIPIGMVAFGNQDLWNGAAFDVVGSSTIYDTLIWAAGSASASTPEPMSCVLWGGLIACGVIVSRRGRQKPRPL